MRINRFAHKNIRIPKNRISGCVLPSFPQVRLSDYRKIIASQRTDVVRFVRHVINKKRNHYYDKRDYVFIFQRDFIQKGLPRIAGSFYGGFFFFILAHLFSEIFDTKNKNKKHAY